MRGVRCLDVRHAIVWLALAACGGDANAAPAYGWHRTRWAHVRWPEPSCFAYSPARRTYACIGSRATNENGRAAAGAVDLVGARGRERHVVWHLGGAAEEGAAVDARMRALGLRAMRIDRTALSDGGWKRIGKYAVRYLQHLHEGDASFEYSASVWLRCPDNREVEVALDDDDLEQGERAVLFAAAGAPEFALSIQGADGGEDVEYWTLDTVVLDPRAVCARPKR